ncbi:hypothetical protein CP973_30185 [Streptomyces albofaciens JCM 4342]|uniref:hypothetical protein n=1 Tax=Streptomyces albofaciens TaxID=66866 RepID=UPI00123A806F|nr:hypothetical protein [Streptomyces albofaciens]KAA6213493.1 hypothetical protein CP973_30185 [Streptomyces albofaciens JCM 4342]
MGDFGAFTRAALAFPAVLFTFALLVVAAYWLLVLIGGAAVDILDGGEGVDGGAAGLPVTVTLSLGVLIAWAGSLTGAALTESPRLRAAALGLSLCAAWLGAHAAARLARRLLPDERVASRDDFVGRVCVIRTGRVTADFGQAEVRADDGATAVVQVRTQESGLTAGSSALIFDYDAEGEFFRVAPFDAADGPARHGRLTPTT